ncbi:hypothetical protein MBLNU459_g0021t1 [Dothideomycetes sp. NU459]
MCGISCIVALDTCTYKPRNPSHLTTHIQGIELDGDDERTAIADEMDASLEAIKHRGPDINGEFYDYDRIRAELLEKTDYHFKGRSDSELIIALYKYHGMNFVHYLRGEFACVLFDEAAQLFIAARDRYGIKPLFWTVQQGRLLIAAEMKAFLPFGWQPEWDVRSLMDAGWNHDERTIFKGISKLRPGYYMTCQGFGHIEHRKYWDIDYPDKRTIDPRTPEEMVIGVRQRLLDAIALRLRADVPVGIYLSGGIDSSVIAGMATHLLRSRNLTMGSASPASQVRCFSIGFSSSSGYDESAIASRTADWLGVNYTKAHMGEAELAERFSDATWHAEHTNPDLNYVGKFALSEVPQAAGYKVVLTGEGADESFAGYPVYLPDYLREEDTSWEAHNSLPEAERLSHLDKAEDAARDYYRSVGADASNRGPSLARRTLNNISTVSSMSAFQPTSLFASWTRTAYPGSDSQVTIANNPDGIVRQKIADQWHPLHSAQYVWSKGHLANIFLTCLGDRGEMAHSIEARTPFLDHEFTAYVNGLPPSAKIRWEPGRGGEEGKFVEKWILREAAKPFITEELYKRTKHPYSAPTTWPAGGPLHNLLAGLVTRENVDRLGFVSWEACADLVARAFAEDPHQGALRSAIVVAQWVILGQRFGVKQARAK